MDRFGSLTPYWEETEFSQEVSPDPYSEEPLPSTLPHSRRNAKSENDEIGDSDSV